MERAYEYRIYPSAAQRSLIERTFGCCRWVYNHCLDVRRAEREAGLRASSVFALQKMITGWKRGEAPWLAEVDSHALQQAVVDLGRAFENFFRDPGRVGFPRLRSKRASRHSYRTNWGMAVADGRHVKLPKLGLVKARVSRVPEGRILSATVKRAPSGKYFVVLCCTDIAAPPLPEGPLPVTGVDAGEHAIATLSDGRGFEAPRALERARRRLAHEQRRLSRKRKGSANWRRQRARVALAHERVANQRRDASHKATCAVVRESQAVAAEGLSVAGMVDGTRGPGRAAARASNRRLADAAMAEVVRQLEYKCEAAGVPFVRVGRFFPSTQLCSCCGARSGPAGRAGLSVRAWACPECGARHDRDVNAAVNIAREGARILYGTAGHAGTGAGSPARTLVERA